MTAEECNDLRSRLENNQLNPKDIASLLSILNVFVSLRQLVEKRKLGILKLLRQLFGFKTEKKDQKQRTYTAGSKAPANSGGRAGRDDYPGADQQKIEHETLKPGDQCPECLKGSLAEAEDGVDYEWSGNAPLSLKVFLLARLICHSCKTTFTADSPVLKTVDDTESPEEEKARRCDKNAKANATGDSFDSHSDLFLWDALVP